MYPIGYLVDPSEKNIVVFENDINNPNNEGFISFWNIIDDNNRQLGFRKRTSKNKALAMWKKLIHDGWKTSELKKVA